ncbi:hypothetical protein ACRALDRAFT_2098084 [Sodiomyces alcalophilus JCM 7366]|uniref:uncharacterized protein n=1 Tax=Sodiomyces alcalophilus JCM 7366 TaxID=591952 RepID=UPI0039B5955D
MAIRIAIREQLAILVVLAVLLGLMILSVPVWVFVNRFISNIEGSQLALTASLKASKISAQLGLIQSNCHTISSRLLIHRYLYDFYAGNATEYNWDSARLDLASAIDVGFLTGVVQGRIYSRNATGDPNGLVNVTGSHVGQIRLPHSLPDGRPAYLDDSPEGYPPQLYPNLTYIESPDQQSVLQLPEQADVAEAFPGVPIATGAGLLLGPLIVNQSYALVSVTVPIRDQFSSEWVIGYITMVFSAASLFAVQESREGLGRTGVTLLVGPTSPTNHFRPSNPASNRTYLPDKHAFGETPVRFILPPRPLEGQADRHPPAHGYDHASRDANVGGYHVPFPVKDFPAVYDSLTERFDTMNNASSMIATHNEKGVPVAVGVARTDTPVASWVVVVEQAKSEVDDPIVTLRNIILGCVFGTAGLVIILVFPLAHLSVLPIRRLKAATEKTVAPPGYDTVFHDHEDHDTPGSGAISARSRMSQKGGWAAAVAKVLGHRTREEPPADHDQECARRTFKIPGKVDDRKHIIIDELTELTQFFNDMSDELVKQYTSLDDKVAERTMELEISKKAAEAANESKTLFIANLSHELKTPLNGILGMCAVCMEETDIVRIKQSLKTLYKSGELLLHLLEDLLSFSKNQIGRQVSLEEKEFRLADIRTQVLSIFDKQVREGRIALSVIFLNSDLIESSPTAEGASSTEKKPPALGPSSAGGSRLKDLCLWGDQHRILQIIINLVSNSVKFTPPGGTVTVRIRCIGEVETTPAGGPGGGGSSRSSSFSRDSKHLGRSRHRPAGTPAHSASSKAGSIVGPTKGTALSINPMESKMAAHLASEDRAPTPPPPGAKSFMFEFEVEDTGPGIPEHLQQRVFEPFVQGDPGLSKKYGGTGLGLSICHQLADIMGGSVSLRSTVGVGSIFTVCIPLRYVREMTPSTASSSVNSRPTSVATIDGITEGAQRTIPTPGTKPTGESTGGGVQGHQATRLVGLRQPYFPTNPTPNTARSTGDSMAAISRAMANKTGPGKLRVLVADDNATNIEVVSRMLKLEDVCDVTIAKDGQEAFDLVKANMDNNMRFDVIFMDVQMPNLDGLQSTKLIRKMGYKAPIVALTAFSEESNVRECMESGMDEFLSKPIRRPALKQVLMKFATIPEEPESANQSAEATEEEEDAHDAGKPGAERRRSHGVKSNGEPAAGTVGS